MESAILFAFGTIPQVLAVAIGMLGILSLLRIQSLNSAIEADSEHLLSRFEKQPLYPVLRDLYNREQFDGFAEEVANAGDPKASGTASEQGVFDTCLKKLELNLSRKSRLSKNLGESLTATVIVILVL